MNILNFFPEFKKKELNMDVPDFQTMMNPVLDIYTKNGSELRPRDMKMKLLKDLIEEERHEVIPNNTNCFKE